MSKLEMGMVAGALSSSKEKALASGRDWELSDDRNYGSWQEMLESELALPEEERIDFVCVVTPVPEGYSLSLIASSRMLMDSNTDSRFSSEIASRTWVNL
jgi:predicted dehydrogenase